MPRGFTLNIYRDESGGYWAEVVELPGCFTQGKTVAETEERAREAIELYLETLAGETGSATSPPFGEPPVKTVRFELAPT